MLDKIISCDLERELARLEAEKQPPYAAMGTALEAPENWGQFESLLADVKQKMAAIRSPEPPDPYPTVWNGPKWKVFIKRCARKLTWWFIHRLTVMQHWRNEMMAASIESLDECCQILRAAAETERMRAMRWAAREKEFQAHSEQIRKLEDWMRQTEEELRRELQDCRSERRLAETEQDRMKWEALEKRLEGRMETRLSAALREAEEQREEAERLRAQERREQARKVDIGQYVDYLAFENRFRGPQAEIRSRIERYLQYFLPGQKVLDIGCGRGEWLELLRDHGVNAFGIDLNPKCVQMCQVKQLNAVQADMFEYLEALEDASLDGVTSIQVIEHITSGQLAYFIRLCYQKMKTGGRLILETPNPATVFTMTNPFYIDPSHIRPVHPLWLEYLLENSGFEDIKLDYPDYSVIWSMMQPYPVPAETDQATANQRIDALNHLLFGPTDYAAIAMKI